MRWLLITSMLLLVAGCARDRYLAEKEQLEEIRKTNTFEAYDNFLVEYPESAWRETLLYYRDQLWVETAITNKDRQGLIEFLRQRPDSAWVKHAHYYLEYGFNIPGSDHYGSCEAACHDGEVEEGHANLSRKHREKIQLDEVQRINTIEAYEGFLAQYPDSIHRRTVIYYRDKLWVEGAIQHRNKQWLAEFVRKYPESEWFDRAHYYLRHDFKVAERDDENCSKCHQADFLRKHQSSNPAS